MMRILKFTVFLLIIIFSAGLTLKMKLLFGWSFDIVLAALVACGLLLDLPEVVALTGFAAWVLNWQPRIGSELLILALAALAAFFGKRVFPWQPWLTLPGIVCAGILAVNGIALYGSGPGGHILFLIEDIVVCTLIAFCIMYLFEWAYGEENLRFRA